MDTGGAAMGVRLGLDVYSLRSQAWTPFEALDYCARAGVRVVHFSEIRLLGGLEPDHLRRVRAHAETSGLALEIGMRSIASGSSIFDPAQGTAEDQLARMIDAAGAVGSPVVRCVIGRFVDRYAPGGIERRIDEAVEALRAVRTRAMDAGVRIAVENHAGDMQARELKALVEAAGPEFVGVCIDSGNALWALEDPHAALDVLAPFVLTSHLRDGAVWQTDEGIAVTWTRMGEGNVDIARFVRTYAARCPGRALSLEVIVPDEPRVLAYRDPQFWDGYRDMRAGEFARFLTLAEAGAPPPPRQPAAEAVSRAQRDLQHVDASLRWTKALLSRS